MAVDERDGDGNFLRRWSQRKLAASRQGAAGPPAAVAAPAAPASVAASAAPAMAPAPPAPVSPAGSAPAPGGAGDVPSALPPVDSLRFDSDFTRFLAPQVDEVVKRQALRKLFSDPRFNVMDGLDVYIDDYSKFEPVPADVVAKLRHARYIFDPPKTRVNEAGHVEDVPDEPLPAPVAGDGAEDAAPMAQASTTQSAVAGGGATADAAATQPAIAASPRAGDATPPPGADPRIPASPDGEARRERDPAKPVDRSDEQ
jgi:hypothetical protein